MIYPVCYSQRRFSLWNRLLRFYAFSIYTSLFLFIGIRLKQRNLRYINYHQRINNRGMSHSDLQSDTIHFLRFPLIVGVVFIHAHLSSDFVNITASDYPVFYVVNEFVSNILVRVSVPLFFFFSGFLFYYKTDFNGITYAKKVKSRIQSLLYLI
jgi:hypothetical protein